MDTYVINGDFDLNVTGHPIAVHSIEEACQRVRFCLLTKKGSFAYDRQLGADHDYLFGEETPDIKLFVTDALSDQKEISIGDVSSEIENGYIRLNIEVFYEDLSMETEVVINGNIRRNT